MKNLSNGYVFNLGCTNASETQIKNSDVSQHFPKQALVFTFLQDKSFENTVGKEDIARNEQFLLFPTAFSTRLENFLPFS